MAHLARHDLPSGDDAFPPSYLDERVAFVTIACDAMERIGTVWPVGKKVRSPSLSLSPCLATAAG